MYQAPKRDARLRNHGHAGAYLREALLEALDHDSKWWLHVEVDFNLERHHRWWARLSTEVTHSRAAILAYELFEKRGHELLLGWVGWLPSNGHDQSLLDHSTSLSGEDAFL